MSENTNNPGPASHDVNQDVPNPETGVGLGAGTPSTFEPEEDRSSVREPLEPREPRENPGPQD